MPLIRHYSRHYVTNPGEYALDRIFQAELLMHKDQWDVFHSFRLTDHFRNANEIGECDYVLIHRKGVIVLECKGGLIKIENNTYWHKGQNTGNIWKPFVKDPFFQLDGNVSTLVKKFKTKNLNPYVVGAVVFPETSFTGILDRGNLWHLGSKISLNEFLLDILEQKPAELKTTPALEIAMDLRKILSPVILPDEKKIQLSISSKKAKERAEENLKILSGLNENQRILIEGPPGSGKSFYARRMILRKVKEDQSKILYLCWNELLAARMKRFVSENKLNDFVDVFPFHGFVTELIQMAETKPEGFTFEDTADKAHLRSALSKLKNNDQLKFYDLVIADQAQDLFGKGIYDVLDSCLNNGERGVEKGSYILFYDRLQPFSENEDQTEYFAAISLIKEYAALYKLSPEYRAISGHGIIEFIENLHSGNFDLSADYGSDIKVKTYKNHLQIPDAVLNLSNDIIRDMKCKKEDLVLLFSSDLISGNRNRSKILDNALDSRYFERLTTENIGEHTEKFRYTTCFSFKGLGSDIVILVINDLFNIKSKTEYQLLLGASCAMAKLYILIDEDSIKSTI
jgi:hypothetical protein